ncbi:MAG: ABC transporter substrate-binding protein [Treponema sp.]|nr:ABC transporter substrate-binding protein [Treponema sp.]
MLQKRKINLFLFAAFILLAESVFISCAKKTEEKKTIQEDFSEFEFNGKKLHGKKIQPDYATQFCIYEYEDGFSLIDICGKEKYLIVPEEKYSEGLTCAADGIIKRGMENIYLASSSAYSLWDALGASGKLGFSSIKENDWYIPSASDAMKCGKMLYAGKYRMPDYELLLKSGCKLAIESTMILHVPKVKEKLEQLGIGVFTDYSSYENNPLGRLEWIKVYGEISGCQEAAFSFFNSQANLLKNIIFDSKEIRSSYFYINTRGMAVVRSPDNYVSNMLKCAGSDYLCPKIKNDTDLASRPTLSVSMEEFYKSSKTADFLFYDGNIDPSCTSLAMLKEKNPLLAEFTAVKNGKVWCAKKLIYQDTAEICQIILDMNKIFSAADDKEIFFFERLK